MKDNDFRGLILQKYYDKKREGMFQWSSEDFKDLPESVDFDAIDLFRICDQLAEHGLIEWNRLGDHQNKTIGGVGRISAYGVDVIEGHAPTPISITMDQSHNVTVQHSSNVQIGNSNMQDIRIDIGKLLGAIDGSQASEVEKQEAKSRLKEFLSHPLVNSILGGLVSSIKL